MPNKSSTLRYAQIKIDISKLEAELELIKEDATAFIAETKGDSDQPVQLRDLPGYYFTLQSKKKWTYSPATQMLEKELKENKKEEEATGAATFEDGVPYLVFNSPKEKHA